MNFYLLQGDESMKKLLIIDGSSMLTTNYYGNLPKSIMFAKTLEEKEKHYTEILHNSAGEYTNALYGMLRTVLKIIEEQQPTHMAIVFDATRNTFRRKLYAEYKGTRSETPGPLKQQFIAAEKMFEDMGIKVFCSSEFEADDFAGSLAEKFYSQIPVVVMTKDVDYLQLVSDEKNIRAWMVQTKQEKADELFSTYGIDKELSNLPTKVFEFTEEIVKSELNLPSAKAVIDMKALGGDTSDNIPGVKGISDTTAASILCEYETVENLYAMVEDAGSSIEDFWVQSGIISRKGALKKLLAPGSDFELSAKEKAFLSKRLATIKLDIPIQEQLSDFEVKINQKAFTDICNRYEFKSLL